MASQTGTLTVDLDAIKENYGILQEKVGLSCEVAAAVKANAYGLGVKEVAPVLSDAGCRSFFIANINEGIELRAILPRARIAVLGGFWAQAADEYTAHNLTPVLNSYMEIENYGAYAREKSQKLPAIIHFDTAMNRLGLVASESQKLLANMEILEGLELQAIMSHFASADDQAATSPQSQYEKFTAIAQNFSGIKKSLANSSGIFRGVHFHMDMVRPGMALYGLNPTPEQASPMRPVASLTAPVLQIHSIEKGEACGYNETYRFQEKADVAIVSIGYADGFLRSLSGAGALFWKNHALPIRGRVSMDLTICDLSNVPKHDYPAPGDSLEIIGVHQSADDLAATAKTIGYEILTTLGPRYARKCTSKTRP